MTQLTKVPIPSPIRTLLSACARRREVHKLARDLYEYAESGLTLIAVPASWDDIIGMQLDNLGIAQSSLSARIFALVEQIKSLGGTTI